VDHGVTLACQAFAAPIFAILSQAHKNSTSSIVAIERAIADHASKVDPINRSSRIYRTRVNK
jgi:hypothetical protein